MKKMLGYDIDGVLDLVGLERKSTILATVLPSVGFIALGAAIGAAVGLAFAPSSGRRLRQDMGDRLGHIRARMKNSEKKEKAQHAVNSVT